MSSTQSKMCDHKHSRPFTKYVYQNEPKDKDHCHIYYIHQDGNIFCHPDAPFPDPENKTKTWEENVKREVAEAFCGDDRLTLIHLPTPSAAKASRTASCNAQVLPSPKPVTEPGSMPMFFAEKLRNICEHCECKKDILWHNYHREEQHFDACFRYVEDKERMDRRCFLKLYTLRVPFLSDLTVSFSMVHHIRAEGPDFAQTSKTTGDNQEHMMAFISGLKSEHIGKLLTDLVYRWQDIARDHLRTSAGMTPRLFVAALLSQYGSITSNRIRTVYDRLTECDKSLNIEIEFLKNKDSEAEDSLTGTTCIQSLNKILINMNILLTGTRSTMHYLADSANVLVDNITPFETYVKARLSEWNENPDLEKLRLALRCLDSCREKIRDNDKLVMVRKNMFQYKTDIKSLQQHIDINVGMISNVIAERDRSIQLSIARSQEDCAKQQQSILEQQQEIAINTAKDSTKMKIIAILTALFLPATFMAIFLTTPIFNFLDDTKPVVNKLPTAIYWGVTLFLSVLFVLGLCLMNHPKIFCRIIDAVPYLKTRYGGGKFYNACSDRSKTLKRNNSMPIKSRSSPATPEKKKNVIENPTINPQSNGINRKSASRESSQGGHKPLVEEFHSDRLGDEEMGWSRHWYQKIRGKK